MPSSPWARWLRSFFGPLPKKVRKPRRRLYLEALENREAPATYIWTGAATGPNSQKWSAPANWQGGQAPTGNPAAVEDLVFDNQATQRTAVNDISFGTGPAVFNSITIAASNYTLSGQPIAFATATTATSGSVNVSVNVTGAVLGMDVQLGGVGVSDQFFLVGNGAQLTMNGHLSGTTGSSLTKEQGGNLTLTNNNSAFTGPIKLDNNGGSVTITNENALGDTTSPTTVGANATLQVRSVANPINEKLLLNGPGDPSLTDTGALQNFSGTNVWAGNIELDSDATLSSAAGSLEITGRISDNGSGHNLTKEGTGQIIFDHVGGNTYRGTTTINNGILTIRNPLALGEPLGGPNGAPPSAANGTIVTQSVTEVGTLQIEDPTGVGFTVLDEQLTLNGSGSVGLGALHNLNGNNTWAGSVLLGSPGPGGKTPSIGVAANTNLTISGVVSSPNGGFGLTKILPGKLILNNHNIYTGSTNVSAGALNIRDSQALGNNGGAGTSVAAGAALELEVDGLNGETDAHGRDLSKDSVTGVNPSFPLRPQLGLTVQTNLTIVGTGINNTGALHSISGINLWTGNITSTSAAIGVDADPHASNTNNYFTNDYSLTVSGDLRGTGFTKVDPGQLILPNANSYFGTTTIQEGWVTIQNNQSLGVVNSGPDSAQPPAIVLAGAALHLKPLTPGTNFNWVKNLVLSGLGITHPFGLINQKGALEILGGDDTIGGPFNFGANGVHTSTIQLNGVAGIGVELLGPDTVSELTSTSSISDATGTTGGGITKLGSRRLILQGDGTYTGPVTINEGVLRAQNNTALGTATSGTATSSDTYSLTTTTVGLGIAELQTITVGGAAGNYTLTFLDGNDTVTLNTSDTALTVQAALNALLNIDYPGGSATVNQAGNVYAVTFGGTLQGVNVPRLVVSLNHPPSPGTIVTVATLMDGDGTALELQYGLPAFNGGIQTGLGIWDDRLILNSPGSTLFGDAPVTVLSSDHLWQGPVSLNVSSTIDVPLNSRLTIAGAIDDAGSPSGSHPALTLIGGGELALGGTSIDKVKGTTINSTYTGTTFVNQGTLVVQNSRALGGTGVPEVQTLTLGGSPGTFTLTFNGQATGPLNSASATLDADVQSALNGLATVSGVGGSVSVGKAGNVLTVTFQGALSGFNQTQLTASPSGGLTVTPGTLIDGAGGTVVANGASLELAGDLAVAGEPLIIQGQGAAASSNVPIGWFNEGSAPINNGQTPNNLPVTGAVTSVAVNPQDPSLIYIATAGGGAWKTKNGGLTWQPLFDSSPVQRLYVPAKTGQFTLTFNGQTTGPLNLNSGTLASDIQTALNGLSSIGSLSPLPANVTVTQSTVNSLVFYIAFFGSLSQTTPPAITAAGVGTTSNPVVSAVTPVMYTSSIVLDPHDPRTMYLGTGVANDTTDSYYGTGIYRSTDGGTTWTPLTNADGSNPLYGLGITKIVVDPGTGNTPTGRLYVATSDQVVNSPVTTQAGVYRYDDSTTQVQTLTVPTRTGAGTFTLRFTNPNTGTTSTTGPLNLNSPTLAADIQTALTDPNTFPAIGVGSALVTQSTLNPLVFTIAFKGTLLAQPQPAGFPKAGTTWSNVGELPPSPALALLVATGTGAPNPLVSAASVFVNLTDATSVPRATAVGQGSVPPGTPGPDDDFRMTFPQKNITWSDLSLQYFDDSTPPTGTAPTPDTLPGQGQKIPVLYAALGTPGGNNNNAVYRTQDPRLATDGTVPTNWWVGDPGAPQDEVQTITINPWQNNPGSWQLSFNGSALTPALGDPNFPNGFPATVTATDLQTYLNNLPTIGGIGGIVSVVLDPASDVNNHIFDVTWGGTMSDTPEPLINVVFSNPPTGTWVKVAETTKGAGIDTRTGEFPAAANGNGPVNGNIKIGSVVTGAAAGGNPIFSNVTVYATMAVPDDVNTYPGTHGQLLGIQKSPAGGKGWAAVSSPGNYMGNQGQYDSSLLVVDANTVYVGGQESSATHTQQMFVTTNGGTGWSDFSVDGFGNGPHTSLHALARDSSNRILVGGDGGIYRVDATTGVWTDINGTLAVTQFNSVAGDPTDSFGAFGGSRANGTERFPDSSLISQGFPISQAWGQVDINDGGQVAIDPKNPSNVYHFQSPSLIRVPGGSPQSWSALLQRSTTGGAAGSWTTILTQPGSSLIPSSRYFPFVLDSVNTSRLLVGGTFDIVLIPTGIPLQESINQGASWKNLNAPINAVTALAAAAYQGNFAGDPNFLQVPDRGANTYDPDTIYITDGSSVYLTKNHAVSWQNRTGNLPSQGGISDIEVDPTNRDTVYVVRSTFDGNGKVFRSTTAGRDPDTTGPLLAWNDITGNLPSLPVYKIVIDPRTGNLYVGTEDGVWLLPSGSTTWQRFGVGLANVQVRDLELNQATNTLLAGTYGRSMYILYLDDGTANAGALRAVSGSSVWTGPVSLAGDATHPVMISANGTQVLQNGTAVAQLNIQGPISDLTAGSKPRLVKIGGGDVILSGSNTYDGVTEVQEGVLIVHNALALGSADPTNSFTVVDTGSALELQSDLQLEPVTLNGDGIVFNNHNTGALRNVSSNNTYTGTLTLNTDSTIGVDTGTTLTIGTKVGLLGIGTIIDNNTGKQLTKELTGTLILASANTYGGNTEVNQGALQVQHPLALGGTANGTDVLDGAQLQLQTPAGGPPVVVSGEALTLSGTGIFGTGALLDSGGSNTWQGPITLDSKPVLLVPTNAAASAPPTTIAVGVTNPTDTLTLDGPVGQRGGIFNLTKVGLGRLTLAQTNSYGGITTVAAGDLRIQDPGALGANLGNTVPAVTIALSNNVGRGYAGLDFNQSQGYAPPDTAGAAGPTSYVETVNQEVAIFQNKATGAPATTDALSDFWFNVGGLAPASSGSGLSDPMVVYDDLIGRFIIGDQDVDDGTHTSTFDIAVSKTSSPTTLSATDWNFYQISTSESGFDADYPGNFGYNHDAFVFTLNMFPAGAGSSHVLVTSVNASDLASGVAQGSLRFFQNDFTGFSLRPTVMHDSVAGDPMWLLSEGSVGNTIDVVKMTNVLSNTATFVTTTLAVGAYATVVAPLNPNGSVVTSNIDSRILKAAEANNTLVATQAISVSATQDDVRWYSIDVTGGIPVLKDQGNIGAGNNTYLYYPAIDINPLGTIGMTYMRSGTDSPTDFMSMYVTGRTPGSAPGTMQTPLLVPSGTGLANYSDFAGGRAGDMSGISVDPVDGSFWAANEFSNTQAGANWGTAIANFTPGLPPNGTIVNSGAALEVDKSAGMTVVGEALTLNGTGTPEVQQLTVAATPGTFRLGFNGSFTGALPITASAAQIQTALNGLPSISGLGGSVTVTPLGSTFVIVFGGTLAGSNQPQITATNLGGANASVSPIADGGQGALVNVSGNNAWTGPVTLQTDDSIGVSAGTQLIVSGQVQDPTPLPVPAASLTKALPGTLVLTSANTYAGKTTVSNGVLNIQNAQALGNSGPEVQTVTVDGGGGTFTLSFTGPDATGAVVTDTTISLGVPAIDPNLAADMQAALMRLSNIGGVGGTVTVTQGTGNNSHVYTVTFGGSLAIGNLPPMTSTKQPGVTATVATVRDGPEGTVVNNGATLQLQGGITVSTEALTLNGPGFNNAGALENVSGNNTWAYPLTLGSNASIGVDGGNDTLTINRPISDGGSGFGVTEVGPGTLAYTGSAPNTYTGLTQVNQGTLQLDKTPTSEIQQLIVLGTAGTFTLTFPDVNGQTTGPLAFNVPASGGVGPTASVQNALQALSTIGAGNVTVTKSGNVYTITFIGALANANQPQITGTGTGGATPVLSTVIDGNPAPAALSGNLTIGDGQPGSAVARWLLPNELPGSTSVTVNSDGTLDLNGKTQTLAALTINDGQATTGASGPGQLTVANLTMTGGTVTAATSGGTLILAGDMTATSDATGPARITGTGKLSLGGATRTILVNDGPQVSDLIINSSIAGTGSEGLTKDGPGRLELDAVNTYTGVTTARSGDLEVDGTIGNVSLGGGTLSGVGTVGTIDGQTPVGTIDPGDNGAGNRIGTLRSQTATLGSGTTFFVDLANPSSHTPPVPGVDNDLLAVTGDVFLSGAVLSGLTDPSVRLNDQFTIIQTTSGTVHGSFAQGASAFLGTTKYTIDYSDTTKVVLTKVLATATLNVVSSQPNSTYGQAVTFTVTVSPETGGPPIPTADTVTITLDGTTYGPFHLNNNDQVIFDPQGPQGLNGPLGVGSHSLQVDFSGDGNYYTATTGTVNNFQVVSVAPTSLSVVTAPASPTYGQSVTLTATIAPPLSSLVPGSVGPTQTVTFTVDSTTQTPSKSVSNNQATSDPFAGLTAGTHSYTVHYSGDSNYDQSDLTGSFALAQDHAVVTVTPSPAAQSYGLPVTLSTKVTPALAGSPGIPSGTVIFWDGAVTLGTKLGQTTLDSNGAAALPPITALRGGTHTITVEYDGDGNYLGATGSNTLVINPDDTSTALISSVNPSAANQLVTFTATVTDQVSGGPTPVGSVTFTIDGGTPTGALDLDGNGQATYKRSDLSAGTHTVVANFVANSNFNASTSQTLSQTVLKLSQTFVSSSLNPSNFNQPVTFTATVSAAPGFTGTPGGHVTFVIDNVPQSSSVPLDGSGKATITISNFTVGAHTVGAIYDTDTTSGFYQSTATPLSQTVNADHTSTAVSAVPASSSTYGQTVTLTATISNTDSPATTVNGGTVSFYDGNATTGIFLGSNTVSGGTTSVQTAALPAGTNHTITAVYSGASPNFLGSTGTLAPYTVSADHTSTTVSAVPASSAFYGQTVTFTATISNTDFPSATVTGGTVTFYDGAAVPANQIGSPASVSGGTASVQTTTLPVGTNHTITAVYSGASPNFFGSTGTLTGYTISADHTSTAVSAVPTSSTYGQTVTFTATIGNTDAPATTVNGGTVSFYDGDQFTGTPLGSSNVSGGTASVQTAALPAGSSHTITAVYAGASPNFLGSSGTLTGYAVSQASTSTTVSASPNPSTYGQAVTFTATVTSAAGTPSGSVTFVIDSTPQSSSVPLDGAGKASITISTLALGNHTISANYGGTSNLTASSSSTLTQKVTGSSATTLASSANPAVFGQTVTFTATVTSPDPGAGTLSGTVAFTVDGAAQPAVTLDGNGQATLTVSNLGGGAHTIGATYSGTNTIAGSSAKPLTETVSRAASTLTVSVSGLPAVVGQPVTFTATVSGPGTATVPSGTVTFVIDGIPQAPVALNAAGQAGFTSSTLAAGRHTVSASYSGDGNFAPSSLQQAVTVLVAPFLGSPNEVWIQQVYHDLFDRAADPAGLSFWEDQLEALAPRDKVASQMVNSDEYRRTFIVHLFRDLLHRVASTDEVNYHLAFLNGGGTYEELTANFLGSSEYLAGGGRSSPATYINDVYQYVLGHTANGDALQYWGDFLQGHSPRDTALAILQTPEAVGRFVRLQYEKLFQREPDGSPNFWFVALTGGTRDEFFISSMISSEEYFNRGAPYHNTQAQEQKWISQVYVDVLGHTIDPQGLAYWFNAQEHGTPRLLITEQVVNSADYRNRLITGLFQALLSRAPSANDLSVYQGYLLQGQTVDQLRAIIMGSPEYALKRGGNTDAGFVNAVYQDVLQRQADTVDLQYWGAKMATENHQAVALDILHALGADDAVVQADYLAILARSADSSGQAYWANQLQDGFRDEYVLAELAATKEYFNRFKTS